ncbi:DUF2934 domain-containing protein [Allochromatium palmeri]|uniref:DUF2934 domain-containing protein n=1 Tax=Allochromatium palmeri TaxID=231048 RepID=A0A6N8EA22_9GAMM|nr:DUF2934 domain-containing protein [Allochromatium palmeri]MTW21005.1 DUF2934 domain-containing protein [Allochromatium palmeri]
MADDKIVTKKTAAKKAVAKKTAARASETRTSDSPLATPHDMTESKPTKKTTSKSTTSKKTAATKATSAAAGKRSKSDASAPPSLADHQGSLRQLATVSEDVRQDMIREAAYYKAEKRRFAPGHDAEDWAAAEREIDELIARAKVMTGR